jgi:hypothetical protein
MVLVVRSAKYEFASSNTTRTTFMFDAFFVWELTPLTDERTAFFIEYPSRQLTRYAIERVLNVVNSYLALKASTDSFVLVFKSFIATHLYAAIQKCQFKLHVL